eukprot:TRINITY_DN6484_c0_g1_i1.p1 TRINITY_DN6484_c0_g1~~TRINITY_DN6484_c0_g1_i1.p1  ORF type:complete len:343 (+),score=50.02 TRINITY_DN6484_c0_g1_i1:83-1111(+)
MLTLDNMKWGHMESLISCIREFVPPLSMVQHKGQAGKIAVVGGCREYTGAPYFAGIAALKLGADLSHVFCARDAASVIKGYSPELIVHPVLRGSYDSQVKGEKENEELVSKVVKDVTYWLPRFDCLVVGPGLGRDPLLMDCVAQIMRDARKVNIPIVVDGDGLFLVTERPELIHGYPLAILTPNVNEHKRLAARILGETTKPPDDDPSSQLRLLAETLGGVTVVHKGASDRISDGSRVLECGVFGSPRRCGGQGDVVAGSIAVFMAWARDYLNKENSTASQMLTDSLTSNPGMMASYAGCLVVRRAAEAAFEVHKRSMVTTNIIDEIGPSVEALFPSGPWRG